MKKLEKAKTRLSKALSESQRRALVLRLFIRTARLCEKAGLEVVSVTSDPVVAEASERRGWGLVVDKGLGLNGSLKAAIEKLSEGPMLVVLPDLPFLRTENIQTVLSIGRTTGCVICPDLRLKGTNMLYLSSVNAFTPMFGYDSYRRHLTSLLRLYPASTFVELGTALDIDTPNDLLLLSKLSTRPDV
ncbi:MAG: 2-phospho-L-lactate guanylyltransferase [Candidatus Caldarchaeum sp.]|nr:2-phospho-L-lactate guanylyltransferase [Candidatus Caldarchaeum sp.]MDW8359812.1 2-phospho-L-lactate guanylyltransferase [Candidatus Caldarchaeum sp.]